MFFSLLITLIASASLIATAPAALATSMPSGARSPAVTT